MKRRVIVLTGLEALAMALVTLLLARQPDPISKWTYERIRIGMREEEVQSIIGIPHGWYGHSTTNWRAEVFSEGPNLRHPSLLKGKWVYVVNDAVVQCRDEATRELVWMRKQWVTDIGMLEVYFDGEGRVIARAFSRMEDVSWLQSVNTWLKGK